MAFEWDENDRAAFRQALFDRLALAFPDAGITWREYHRRLVVTFPDGDARTLWEPNFYFSRGDCYSDDRLLNQATTWIGEGRRMAAHRHRRNAMAHVYEVYVHNGEPPDTFFVLAAEYGAIAQRPAGAEGPCFRSIDTAESFRTAARAIVGTDATVCILSHKAPVPQP
jgi:hypothetical protein